MTQADADDAEAYWDNLRLQVSDMRTQGMTRFQIERSLKEDFGVDEDSAWILVNEVFTGEAQTRAVKVRGGHNLTRGPLYLLGGLAFTGVSYWAGEDSYFVFYGAIISGILMTVAGVYDVLHHLGKD